MILELGLQDLVVPFQQSDDRLYYLRGTHIYESGLKFYDGLPYRFDKRFSEFLAANVTPPYTSDAILGGVASLYAPGLGGSNGDRAAWCQYFSQGQVRDDGSTSAYPAGTPIRAIGYWNLLYDRLGDEGFDYAADGAGYTSNVINWNAADAMQANNDYGSSSPFKRLDGGYSGLFEALAAQVTQLAANFPGSGIQFGCQLISVAEAPDSDATQCRFARHGGRVSEEFQDIADVLILAMPRRSLELVADGSPELSVLNREEVKYLLESAIDQPAMKVVMTFDQAWWTSPACRAPPNLAPPYNAPNAPASQGVGGATITDLPLRMIYYFANNVPGGPGAAGGPYVLLASYDDMNYSGFWKELETSDDHVVAPSAELQPLHGPTQVPVDSPMARLLLRQLSEVHGMNVDDIPAPTSLYYQDWSQDPFGGGYHGWAAHYDICRAMDQVRAPYQKALQDPNRRVYIVGSCYSFDQAWVEGAFCTAESVLTEFLQLPPLNKNFPGYTLVCKFGG
jgi:hypothetical protein